MQNKRFKAELIFRSTLFWVGMIILIIAFLPATILFIFFPLKQRHIFISQLWSHLILIWLRITCKINYKVSFKATLPNTPAVIMCKHQSAWETFALQLFLPLHVWVIKQELLKIPIFGWQLRAMGPIAINRNSGITAQKQLLAQGQLRINQGFWIMIFPEGTRIPVGKRGRYRHGGAKLANSLNIPLVPVAHNAGEFWPKHTFIKYPGTIEVIIGEAISTIGRDPRVLTQEVETWIENEMLSITSTATGSARE